MPILILCPSQNAVTKNSFGNNITGQLKAIQELHKVGKELSDGRQKAGHFSGNRRPFFKIKEIPDIKVE